MIEMKKKYIILITIIPIIIFLILISNINYTKAANVTLASKVIGQSKGNSWSSGASGVYYTNNHEYRYVGLNVNNYVSFNNDLYRIIGVFDSNTTGVSGNLVKLIKDREIGVYSWGVYNDSNTSTNYQNWCNDWTGQYNGVRVNANVLLNDFYLYGRDTSPTYASCKNWTYYQGLQDKRTQDCGNIVNEGIKNNTIRNYIQSVTWNIYGYPNGTAISKQNWYKCERNQYSGCTSGWEGGYSSTTTEKIGLMYVSDYLYASSNYSSSDTTTSNAYFSSRNWLHYTTEWTINPDSAYSYISYLIDSEDAVVTCNVDYAAVLRPTFYLKSQVYVTGGDGSFTNPYTIACDNCN